MKTRHFAVGFLVCAVLILVCANGPVAWAADAAGEAKAANPLQQTLIAAQQALFDATKKKDVEYVKKAIADDFVLITTTGDSAGKDEIVEAARSGAFRVEPRLYGFQAVPLNDGAAILTYDVVMPEGKPRYQHISSTWVKQGDQWKLKFQQSTPNLFSLGDE